MTGNPRHTNPEVTKARGRVGGLQAKVNAGKLDPDAPELEEAKRKLVIANAKNILGRVAQDQPLTRAERAELIQALLGD